MRPREILELAAELARKGEPFALATVVRREPPSLARVGDRGIVTADGTFRGWLGGSCTRSTVVREARAALADGGPRLVALDPDPDAARRPGIAVHPMTCHSGGSVDVYIEPVLPAPRIAVYGETPVADALRRLGPIAGFEVESDPDGGGERPPARRAAVVATQGEGDERAILAALGLAPAYLGVVASRRRFAAMEAALRAGGATADDLAAIDVPAGLDIGARTPGEIAVSILAGIVERLAAAPDVGATLEPAAPAETEPTLAEPPTAVDPICGMTVEIGDEAPRATFEGETFWFCCDGCRARFEAEPARYAAAGESA